MRKGDSFEKRSLTNIITNFIMQSRRNKVWRRVTNMLAVLVVFVTTYMLILPAITATAASITVSNVTYSDASFDGTDYTAELNVTFTASVKDILKNDYKLTYQLPTNISVPSDYKEGSILYDDSNSKFTYYYYTDSNGNWWMEFTFLESYISQFSVDTSDETDDVTLTGHFGFTAEMGADTYEVGKGIEVKFSDSLVVTIPDSDIEYGESATGTSDINVEKSASSYDSANNCITYTVTVSSTKGTEGEITLSDVLSSLPSGLTVKDVSVSSVAYQAYDSNGSLSGSSSTLSEGSAAGSSTYTQTYAADAGLTVVLPQLYGTANSDGSGTASYGGQYMVTYTVYFDNIKANVSSYVNNTASATSSNSSSGNVIVDSASVSTYVEHTVITKSATSNDDGTVTWYVYINAAGDDISGYVLKDPYFVGLPYNDVIVEVLGSDGSYSTAYNGFNKNQDDSGNVTSITFQAIDYSNALNTNVNTHTYRISYTTTSDGFGTGGWKTNTATLYGSDGSTAIGTGTSTGYVSGGSISKALTKSEKSSDGDTAVLSWTSSITIPAGTLKTGTEITDSLSDSGNDYKAITSQWYTYTQIKELFGTTYMMIGNTSINTGYDTAQYAISLYDRTLGQWVTLGSSALVDGGTYVSYNDFMQKAATAGNYDQHTYTAFKITFISDVTLQTEGTLTLAYSTTADISSDVVVGSYQYYNTIASGSLSSSATYEKYQEVTKMDGNEKTADTATTTTDGTVTWKVRIYIPEGCDQNYYTVTDTLPAGVTLSEVYLNEWTYNAMTFTADASDSTGKTGTLSGTLNNAAVTGTVTTQTVSSAASNGTANGTTQQVVTIKLPYESYQNSTGQFVWICYVCKLDAELDEGSGVTSVTVNGLENTVTVKDSSNTEYGSDAQAQDVTYTTTVQETKKISKGGSWDNTNNRWNYSVVVNPDGADLIEGSDTLEFTDVISPNYSASISWGMYATLIQNTVKFYELIPLSSSGSGNTLVDEDGNSYDYDSSSSDFYVYNNKIYYKSLRPDIAWTYSQVTNGNSLEGSVTHTISAKLPDSTRLLVEYTYSIYVWGANQINNLSNTATISGVENGSSYYQETVAYSTSSFTAGIYGTQNFSLVKVAETNYGTVLEGAEYTVYRWTLDSDNNGSWVSTGVKFTTDSNGSICITPSELGDAYAANTAYYIVETAAPKGYILDSSTKYYFYWTDSSTTTCYPDGFTDNNSWNNVTNLTDASKTVYATNALIPETTYTSVGVTKVWKDADGNEITDSSQMPADEVSVKLYRYEKEEDSSDAGSGNTVTVSIMTEDKATVYATKVVPKNTEVYLTLTNSDQWNDPWGYIVGGAMLSIDSGKVTISADDVTQDITIYVGNVESATITYNGESSSGSSADSITASDLPTTGTYVGTYTLGKSNNWTMTVSNLAYVEYEDSGAKHTWYYYFVETEADGYTATYSTAEGVTDGGSITITNTTEKKASVSVEKTWTDQDGNAISGLDTSLPTSVAVDLYRYASTTAPTTGSGDSGSGDSGSSGSAQEVDENHVTLTVYYGDPKYATIGTYVIPIKTDVTVAITMENASINYMWDNNGWQSGEYTGNNVELKINVSADYTLSFSASLQGVSNASESGATVKLTYEDPYKASTTDTPTTDSYSASDLPTNGVKVNDTSYTITPDTSGNWSLTVSDLDYMYYAEDGTAYYYYYYFVEQEPSGYTATYSTSEGIGDGSTITINNQAQGGTSTYTSIQVDKSWAYQGDASTAVSETAKSAVTFHLYRVNTIGAVAGTLPEAELVGSVTLDGETDSTETTAWTYTWEKLLKTFTTADLTQTIDYDYYITEEYADASGVTSVAYSVNSASCEVTELSCTQDGTTKSLTAYKVETAAGSSTAVSVTNTVEKPEDKSISAQKVWENYDEEVLTGTDIPENVSVTITLYFSDGTNDYPYGGSFDGNGAYVPDSTGAYSVTLNGSADQTEIEKNNPDMAANTVIGTDGWSVTWSGLSGDYDYYVVESSAPEGYTTYYSDTDPGVGTAGTASGTADETYYVINREASKTTDTSTGIRLEKDWLISGKQVDSPSNASATFSLWRVAAYTAAGNESQEESQEVALGSDKITYNSDGSYYAIDASAYYGKFSSVKIVFSSTSGGNGQIGWWSNSTETWTQEAYSKSDGTNTVTYSMDNSCSGFNVYIYWPNDGTETVSEVYLIMDTDTGSGTGTASTATEQTQVERYDTVTLSTGDATEWSCQWSKLPLSGTVTVDGVEYACTYTYYISEDAAVYGESQTLEDFTVSCVQTAADDSGNGTGGSSSTVDSTTLTYTTTENGTEVTKTITAYPVSLSEDEVVTVTITNESTQTSIVLPSTGSAGRGLYYLLGILCMLLAILGISLRHPVTLSRYRNALVEHRVKRK